MSTRSPEGAVTGSPEAEAAPRVSRAKHDFSRTSHVAARVRRLPPGIAALVILAGCGGVDPDVPIDAPPIAAPEWQLVFSDEFDGAELDTSKWNTATGNGCPDLCGWGNNELQIYGADNIEVTGGMLNIIGRREADGSYTSARINTLGKFDFTYGRVEVSARVPSGQGIWPAIWMLASEPHVYGHWPTSGEIDIMEAFNYGVNGNNEIRSTVHYGLSAPPFYGTGANTDLATTADVNFHTYAVEWEEDRLRFFVDGQHHQSQNSDGWFAYYPADESGHFNSTSPFRLGPDNAPFDRAFHLLLNFAIGGNPVGYPDGSTIFPQSFSIDYVRVYQCANGNPETGAGCGMADASVVPLEAFDGTPIEHAETASPYLSSMDLYVNGPEVLSHLIGEETGTNALEVDGYVGPGASVVNDPLATDPVDPSNTAWHFSVSGDVANIYLASQNLDEDPLLNTGFDFSGEAVGEVAFDLYVNSIGPGTTLLAKLDSGWPNLGEVALPSSEIAVGQWKSYSAKFSDLLANPGAQCCGGQGVDLANVVNPFVLEAVGGAVDLYVDNVRINRACYVVGACKAQPRAGKIPDFVVFDDEVNLGVWNNGIVASDSGVGWADYTDSQGAGNKVHWAVIDDSNPDRGQVIEVTFNDSDAFGVWFIQSSNPVNLSSYDAGAVEFDIIVDDYGNNTAGITMKVDCFFPCTSNDKPQGFIADGEWQTVSVPVATMTSTGLDLLNVNTGVVIFPTIQSGEIRFRVDNIRWVGESEAPPLEQVDLPVTFDDPGVEYLFTDFGGTFSQVVADPADPTNNVASVTKGAGAETWAGTIVGGDSGFANPIPFTSEIQTMSVRVYSPAANIPILLKVENAADGGIFGEVMVMTTMANAWETLVFDFTGFIDPVNQTYGKAVLFPNFGAPGDDRAWYFDDIRFGDGVEPLAVDLPVTFDDPNVDYRFTDFGGPLVSQVVADPTDPANNVASVTKSAGAETWAGTIIGGDSGFANPIPFTADTQTMSVRVYSPAAGVPIRLKVEHVSDGGIFGEIDVSTTMANAWETLVFNFAGQIDPAVHEYHKAVLFPNFGAAGDDRTWYFDDIEIGGGVAEPPPMAATEPQSVFDDAVDPRWELGLGAAEGPGWGNNFDGATGTEVRWEVVAASDAARGQIIRARFLGTDDGGAADQGGVFFALTDVAADMSGFADGSIVFDVRVENYHGIQTGLAMKIDCVWPCTSGDQAIGYPGNNGAWETVTIPVSQLTGTGLNLTTVNTGIVVFPWVADQAAASETIVVELDNIRWEPPQ